MNPNEEKLIHSLLTKFTIMSEYKTELYSLLIPLILSKQFFKKSSELKSFIETVLGLSFKDYVYNSRSILLGRVMNYLSTLTVEESVSLNKRVTNFILDTIKANNSVENTIKSNKTKTSFFNNWYDYMEKLK